ncbi:hypothetical protein ANO11243_061110 [Dothideomycetidae sp. 11243]|nr:hypothetical protein ANO11243_061110 [fungal sp. No.11243]
MASLPPQQPAQRRTSSDPPQAEASSQSPSLSHWEQLDYSATSTSSSSTETETKAAISNESTSSPIVKTDEPSSRPALQRQETDLKKCWICFADESEDTPETSEWRSPCPCALVAHEECLLDWIADMESPSSRKRSLAPPKLLCPQCKSEIRLARPWNPLVELVKVVDRVSSKIVAPCALLAAMSTVTQAFTVHGIHSIFAVFGQNDALRILNPYLNPRRYHEVWDVRESVREVTDHWRLYFGLPLITPMLILSRASIADSILPVLPIVFFATQGDATEQPADVLHWPPSASMTMAVLPYMRGMYNAYYRRVWGAHVQRWTREIQPRVNQGTNENEGANPPAENRNEGEEPAEEEGVFEIRVDGNIWNNWDGDEEDDEAPHRPLPNVPEPQREDDRRVAEDLLNPERQSNADGNVQDPPQAEAVVPEQPVNAPPAAQPEQQAPIAQGERRLSISTSGLAERVLGALLFPTIAGLSGEVLRLCLPTSWTTSSSWNLAALGGYRTKSGNDGLLAKKWGRSIVGGCLFVVLKDAVMLYVKWKMAQQHRKRRVLDYEGKRKRGIAK